MRRGISSTSAGPHTAGTGDRGGDYGEPQEALPPGGGTRNTSTSTSSGRIGVVLCRNDDCAFPPGTCLLPAPPPERWRVGGVLCLVSVADQLSRFLIYQLYAVPVDPDDTKEERHFKALDKATDLDIQEYSLLSGYAFCVPFALALLLMARAVNFGCDRKWLLFAGICLWAVAVGLMGIATGFQLLLASRVLMGLGMATVPPCGFGILAQFFESDRPNLVFAHSLLTSGIYVGAGTSSLCLLLAMVFGWRAVCFGVFLFCVICAATLAAMVPTDPSGAERPHGSWGIGGLEGGTSNKDELLGDDSVEAGSHVEAEEPVVPASGTGASTDAAASQERTRRRQSLAERTPPSPPPKHDGAAASASWIVKLFWLLRAPFLPPVAGEEGELFGAGLSWLLFATAARFAISFIVLAFIPVYFKLHYPDRMVEYATFACAMKVLFGGLANLLVGRMADCLGRLDCLTRKGENKVVAAVRALREALAVAELAATGEESDVGDTRTALACVDLLVLTSLLGLVMFIGVLLTPFGLALCCLGGYYFVAEGWLALCMSLVHYFTIGRSGRGGAIRGVGAEIGAAGGRSSSQRGDVSSDSQSAKLVAVTRHAFFTAAVISVGHIAGSSAVWALGSNVKFAPAEPHAERAEDPPGGGVPFKAPPSGLTYLMLLTGFCGMLSASFGFHKIRAFVLATSATSKRPPTEEEKAKSKQEMRGQRGRSVHLAVDEEEQIPLLN